MIVVDANILLYAHDSSSPRQAAASDWLTTTIDGPEQVGLGLVTILAFLRIATDVRIFSRPLAPADAIAIVEAWLDRPNVSFLAPTDRHWRTLAEHIEGGQAKGPRLMDAHLAALAREHGAVVATTDRDFRRFPGLRAIDPTAP